MLRRIHVGDNERVFIIRHGRFEAILESGSHVVLGTGVQIERHSMTDPALTSDWKDLIVKQHPGLADKHFVIVEAAVDEMTLVYFDGRLLRVVPPSSRVLFWKGEREITLRRVSTTTHTVGRPRRMHSVSS